MTTFSDRLCDGRRKPSETSRLTIRGFFRAERGSMTILGLFLFLIILITVGLGVDLMRFERERVLLQSTLDRATLGAADLDQTLDPKVVVRDYLEKAGLGDRLRGEPIVEEGLGFRKITAVAETVVPTHFMHMSGVDSLNAVAGSVAEESIGAVEISLVLDISGSMADASRDGSTKIALLQSAAKDFVDLLLEKSENDETSISIVPYATQVNAGKTLLDQFTNVTQEHDYSHCVNFIPEQFSDTDLDRDDKLDRTAHFDPWTVSEGSIEIPACPIRAGSEITVMSNSATKLKDHIGALTALGSTSIEIGMKWGVALLDPSMKDIVSNLSGGGVVPAEFASRPTEYDEDVIKVVIVMTDGENTDQPWLNPSMRSGLSNVWYNAEADQYSAYKSSGKLRYFWPDREYKTYDGYGYWNDYGSVWSDHPYGDDELGDAVQLTYPELFNRASMWFNAGHNQAFSPSYPNRWYTAAVNWINATAKDQRTKNICRIAKRQGIIIYGIAFEAPANGLKVIENCASSDSHVYDVDGLDIEKAFVSIASSIQKLRLTQ